MKPRVSHQKTAAMTLTEVLVVIGVLAILLTILVYKRSYDPNMNPKWEGQMIGCVDNLKHVGLSFGTWAGDHNDKYPFNLSATNGGTMELANGRNAWINFLVMSNQLSTPKVLFCPADTDKIAATDFTADFNNSNISYFINLDADVSNPQMFLSGDDNFAVGGVPIKSGLLGIATNSPIAWTSARHYLRGNIVYTDGSVNLSVNKNETRRLTDYIYQTGVATNRLAIP
jgi:prepilin-type processing-associated H-X9-DG protein